MQRPMGLSAPCAPLAVARSQSKLSAPPGALSPLGRALSHPLNSRSVRRFALPGRLPASLARHCVEEYTNLALILPPLSREFANKEAE